MSEKLIPEIRNAYWFQGFNAISWTICCGSPMILFARDLHASATTIGILSGLPPLMTIIQLFVSRYAEEIGYKKLMMRGWSMRVCTLVFLAILPFAELILNQETVVNLLLTIMFAYTLLRGASTCAWMPWITSIVPESLRGQYLALDRTFINIASVIAWLISAAILGKWHGMGAFSSVFFVSFTGGVISLYFLNRIPEPVPISSTPPKPTSQPTWREVLRDAKFQRLLSLGAIVQLSLAANGTFVILFLREEILLSNSTILWANAGSALVGMLALNTFGKWMDRAGSRPFLWLILFWWIVYFAMWILVSTGKMPHRQGVAIGLMIISGFSGAVYELAQTRLLLNTVGNRQGNTQYFALYAVIVSLLIGFVPIPWGIFLDALKNYSFQINTWKIDRYTIFFFTEWLMLFVIGCILLRVKEPKSHPAKLIFYEIFVGMPSRGLSTLFQRFR